MRDSERDQIEPYLEPQPAKKIYLYACELEDASCATAGGRTAPLRRATYPDLGKSGFAPEAIPKRVWEAVDSVAEWMSAALDEFEGAPRQFGENEGKRRITELRHALHKFGYATQADAQGWKRNG